MNSALLMRAGRPSGWTGPSVGRGSDHRKDHSLRPSVGHASDRRKDHSLRPSVGHGCDGQKDHRLVLITR